MIGTWLEKLNVDFIVEHTSAQISEFYYYVCHKQVKQEWQGKHIYNWELRPVAYQPQGRRGSLPPWKFRCGDGAPVVKLIVQI